MYRDIQTERDRARRFDHMTPEEREVWSEVDRLYRATMRTAEHGNDRVFDELLIQE